MASIRCKFTPCGVTSRPKHVCSTLTPSVYQQHPRSAPKHSNSSGSASASSSSKLGRSAARLVAYSAAPDATGAPAGQLSAALMEAMQQKISEALEASSVSVSDVYGDGRHVNIDVVSKAFEGKNSVQRQRMVYKAIWLELQDAVHAVDSMSTKTPEEAA